jgi:hypothetical protein
MHWPPPVKEEALSCLPGRRAQQDKEEEHPVWGRGTFTTERQREFQKREKKKNQAPKAGAHQIISR